MEASSGGHNIPKIMTFRPTLEEFKDFNKYIRYMESQGAHKAGIAKIIPPPEWKPRRDGYDDIDIMIPAPICQSCEGHHGLYTQFNIQKKALNVKEFEKLANSSKYRTPRYFDMDDLERKYWSNQTNYRPIYGADISGSLYDDDQDYWNVQRLGTILDCVSGDYGIKIEGVNTAYLYFGMWKTSFAWHTEDMDLYSINYLHFGAPKFWYAIPPEHGRRFERFAAGFFPGSARECNAFLRHKMTVISPKKLKEYSIPYDKIAQHENEFMVTFPYGYHAGFNTGYNCAESTNFATERWIEYGKRCNQCLCRKDGVKIEMDCFVRRFQPERYEMWKAGRDIAPHPEDDQTKLYKKAGSNTSGKVGRRHPISKGPPKRKGRPPKILKIEELDTKPTTKSNKTKKKNESDSELGPPHLHKIKSIVKSVDSDTDSSDTIDYMEESHEEEENDMEKTFTKTKEEVNECKLATSMLFLPDAEVAVPWAEFLKDVWVFKPTNFEAEKQYNELCSEVVPHCSVCSMFRQIQLGSNTGTTKLPKPTKSLPMIPEMCFAVSAENPQPFGLNTLLDEDGLSPLLVCKDCKVCVHASCYGIKDKVTDPWRCSRCVNESVNAECCLCMLQGGALKSTTDGRWVHVICSLAIPEVLFEDVQAREPINVTRISQDRLKLRCMYCSHVLRKKAKPVGICVQCSVGRCISSFHTTCGHAAGVTFETSDWPFPVYVTCTKHGSSREESMDRDLTDLKVGDKVIAKHFRIKRYYISRVARVYKQIFYEVDFDDGSFTNNIFPEDIESRNCARYGPPKLGTAVQVRWTDGELYGGKFRGTNTHKMYEIEFEDGSETKVRREDIFRKDEKLPKKIQNKVSYATERKHDIFYDDKVVQKSRRKIENNRYLEDFER